LYRYNERLLCVCFINFLERRNQKMVNARIIFNHHDEPEVVLFDSGRYDQPIAIVEVSQVKSWAKEIDERVRQLKKLRRARAKKKQ